MLAEPLPQRDALAIASQLAAALEAVHDRGAIVSCLRPAAIAIINQAVTIQEPVCAPGSGARPAAYESPEQVRGRAIDRRADIWAFGCVLFEMLSGAAVFTGDTVDSARTAVLDRHPDWRRLPPDTPTRIINLLRHCLNKDPKDRLHDIADARIEIDATLRADTEFVERGVSRGHGMAARLSWVAAALLLGVNAWLAWQWWRADDSPAGRGAGGAVRAAVPIERGTSLFVGRGASVAISRDGRHLVYVGEAGGTTQLFLRALDRADATPLAGTDGAADPFFSPDGRWIGFVSHEQLMKVALEGGAPVTIADVTTQRGMTWATDDTILVTPRDNTGVWMVPAAGGTLEHLTTLASGEASHRWPHVLPGGAAVLYTIWNGGWDEAQIAIQPLADRRVDSARPRRILVKGASVARFIPAGPNSGSLIYARGETVESVAFDLERLEISGPPVTIAEGVITNLSGGAQYTSSPAGVIAHISREAAPPERDLMWVSRDGTTSTAARVKGLDRWYDLSPDGTRVARYRTDGPTRDVWIDDLAQGTLSQISRRGEPSGSGPTDRLNAIWSGDGRHVAYSAGMPFNLFLRAADGSGDEVRLTTSTKTQWPASWSTDGRTIAFVEVDALSASDIWLMTLSPDRKPGDARAFLTTPFNESAPMISPDGRWLAYQSNESGRYEIYVQPIDGGARAQVSSDEGVYPRWSPDGRELFYRAGPRRARVAAAAFDPQSGHVGEARALFEVQNFESMIEVDRDGRRFLMMPSLSRQNAPALIHVITNWQP